MKNLFVFIFALLSMTAVAQTERPSKTNLSVEDYFEMKDRERNERMKEDERQKEFQLKLAAEKAEREKKELAKKTSEKNATIKEKNANEITEWQRFTIDHIMNEKKSGYSIQKDSWVNSYSNPQGTAYATISDYGMLYVRKGSNNVCFLPNEKFKAMAKEQGYTIKQLYLTMGAIEGEVPEMIGPAPKNETHEQMRVLGIFAKATQR